MAFASAGVSPCDSAHGPTSQLRSSRVTDGMTNQVRVATMTALMTRVRNASGHGAIVGPRNVTAAAATGDRGSREVTPRFVVYRRPRAKKPSSARTTTMMMIQTMMLKTHLL
jgi:hypothetical protein